MPPRLRLLTLGHLALNFLWVVYEYNAPTLASVHHAVNTVFVSSLLLTFQSKVHKWDFALCDFALRDFGAERVISIQMKEGTVHITKQKGQHSYWNGNMALSMAFNVFRKKKINMKIQWSPSKTRTDPNEDTNLLSPIVQSNL
jgi:hypothetical protein